MDVSETFGKPAARLRRPTRKLEALLLGVLGTLASACVTEFNNPVPLTGEPEPDFPRGMASVSIFGASIAGIGHNHTCAVTSGAGEVYCWGKNDYGQLGDGTTTTSTIPVRVCAPGETAPCTSYLNDIVELAVGSNHACARTSTDDLYCWGKGGNGEIGDGRGVDQPVSVQVTGSWISVAAGQSRTCGIDSLGTAQCWGSSGQVGSASHRQFDSPVAVMGLPKLDVLKVSVSESGDFSCALISDGTVYCWSANDDATTTVQVCAEGESAPCSVLLLADP